MSSVTQSDLSRPTAENTSSTHAEVPRTLAEPAPRALGLLDQLGLWGNLGVSLLGFGGAVVLLHPNGPDAPPMSLLAALVATVVGTVLGAGAIALASVAGARTGAPGMVLLRGLFGARLSYVPTVLNTVQMLGWSTFEVVTIATAASQLLPSVPHWVFVVVIGLLTTGLALKPLGTVRVLRRYVTVAMVLAVGYLFVQLLRAPLPGQSLGSESGGSWSGFSIGVDTALAVAVSWVPVAADYSRHSRTVRAAAIGPLVGFSLSQVACYALGLLALLTVAGDPDRVFSSFVAVPLGGLAFAVLVLRELDQSFTSVYSTTVSLQNLAPRWDRRIISVVIGVVVTLLALNLDIYGYASFLSLIGSLFVPMFAVLVVDYFLLGGVRTWDLSAAARPRRLMLLPWAAGFVVYQLIYPGQVGWWAQAWEGIAGAIGFVPQAWMSASLLSFLVAGLVTGVVHLITRRRSPVPATT
ncbi:purine-cytosine permease family protein [uncultured Friedmanniella sp.]|uniref:purine-cytosine permease family protein n=1 Tax=uncultured Friedmanniella sp. TaxID=335381 RepID=UPI0035C9B82B